jgi:nucleotide-binding universal stress UspA family protein
MSAPVVVGFDGSSSARAAVQYGVGEALLRGCDLRLVHAFSWPLIYPPFGAEYDPHDHGPRVAMLKMLTAMARDVQRDHPDLAVDTRIVDGSPGGVLVAASSDATVLVVGHRGMGGFTGLLAGSVGMQTTGHAHCPVVVVRGKPTTAAGPQPGGGPIVLGFDGSPSASMAANAAFAQAQRWGDELLVVHHHPPHTARAEAEAAVAGHRSPRCTTDEFAASLSVAAAGYADVMYRTEVVHGGSAATALIAAARSVDAGLLVVGARGVGGFRGLVMGSTSRSLVEHAPCPVMVIPPGVHAS